MFLNRSKLKSLEGTTGGFDWVVLAAMLILIAFSVLTIYSTSFSENQVTQSLYIRQFLYAVVGLVGFFVISRMDYKLFAQLSILLYFTALVLLVLTFVWGLTTRGSTRWIDLGWVRLQPSEVIKPILIMVLAFYYSTRERITLKHFLTGFLIAAIPAALVFRQPDLGSAIIILGIWFVLTIISSTPWKYIVTFSLVGLLLLPIGYNFLHDYQKSRLTTFINPSADPLGSGYNIIQSIIAVGSGQVTGRGFGRGTQSHLNFLPEQHTDFIFATMAEELGFLGTTLVLGVFLLLLVRLVLIARDASDQFGMLVVNGIVVMILLQLFINIGMNVGLMPVTGITLPFISFGGSSLVAMIFSIGIAEAIARSRRQSYLEIK